TVSGLYKLSVRPCAVAHSNLSKPYGYNNEREDEINLEISYLKL
ncbi:5655_t:CDS:1, partial [Gigaspora rosea]